MAGSGYRGAHRRTTPARRGAGRTAARVASVLLGMLAATVLLVGPAPIAFGARTLVVMSGSMSPTLRVGDVVLDRVVAPASLRPGDVVTFRDPLDASRLITHRVRAVRVQGASVSVTTRGDANSGTERWAVARSGRVGRVVLRVPALGLALVWLRGAAGRLLTLALPALALGALEVRRIWRGATPATFHAIP